MCTCYDILYEQPTPMRVQKVSNISQQIYACPWTPIFIVRSKKDIGSSSILPYYSENFPSILFDAEKIFQNLQTIELIDVAVHY